MGIETDLNRAPYWDTHDPNDDYYGILHKPAVSVQTRELNEVQSIFRTQIERLGDNLFKSGTIVEGCNFRFHTPYPYVKIMDNEQDGSVAVPSRYVGLFAKNSANLQAFIINSEDGFESTDPNLKTLYLHYRNSGSDGNTHAFTAGDTLTIFDANVSIFKVQINNGGLGFSNNDQVIFTPALVVNVSSGTFANGDYVTQPTTGANLQIIEIDENTLADRGQIILRLQPRNVDLANASVNATAWSVANNDSIHNSSNTATGTVEMVIGSGADARVLTNGSGTITSVEMETKGSGYTTLPVVRVRSSNNSSGLSTLSLSAQNWLARVTVSSVANAVGNGYAFSVSEGVIYQKGVLLRVAPQTVIVSKYSQYPNNVSVGFRTLEEIVDSNVDTNLLDPATGDDVENTEAPGADRLRLTPTLFVDSTDTEMFRICSWSEGNPYRINPSTVYNRIGDEMARRTYEDGGDFMLDKFLVTTRSPYIANNEGNTFSVVVDPGTAYIRGYRVATTRNFVIDNKKGIDTAWANNRAIQLSYGNWLEIQNIGGVFQFSTGDKISLYDTAKEFLSNSTLIETGNTTPVGNEIGTARIRSLVPVEGVPGTVNAKARLYLFDIRMNAGRNFRDTRSVYYDGTYKGIADVSLTLDPTTETNVAVLGHTGMDSLVFRTGADTLKTAANTTYQYRTIDQTVTVSNSGILSKSLASTPNEFFPWSGNLTNDEMQDLYVVPLGNNLVRSVNIAGTVSINTTTNTVIGTGTSFLSDLEPGMFILAYQNSTVNQIRRITAVVNNTLAYTDGNAAITQSSLAAYRIFPKNVPVPFGTHADLSANVDANGNILTLNFGGNLQGSASVNCAIAVNVERRNTGAGTKQASRDEYVKLRLANVEGGVIGPWCLGVPDVFRLKAVYVADTIDVNAASREVTNYFYIDSNQAEDYLDLSYLYVRPNSGFTLSANDYLLVKFDRFTVTDAGYYNTVSYLSSNAEQVQATDSLPLASLGSSINSFEVPEVTTAQGKYYDLLGCFDFRPIASNTVAPSTNAATAPINPANTLSFGDTSDPSNDKKFPVPDSILRANIEYYVGRIDSVVLSKDGNISVLRGTPVTTTSIKLPNIPLDSVKLNDIYIPPYPNLPQHGSLRLAEIVTTRMANERFNTTRFRRKTIQTPLSPKKVEEQQPTRYTHADVGKLERRIRNLEYVASLSMLESDVTNRTIPSSIDRTLNRFKYGFFADPFETDISQDVDNPQYAASIANDKLRPPVMEWTLRHGSGIGAQPYVSVAVVTQNNATTNTILNTTLSNVVANNWALRIDQLHMEAGNPLDLQIQPDDIYVVEFANVAGPATLFFHVPPTINTQFVTSTTQNTTVNLIQLPPVDPVDFKIYQGNTLIKSTHNVNDTVALTAEDQTRLKSNAVPADWFMTTNFAGLTRLVTVANDTFVSGSGKISWTHNPANGNRYTIVSRKYNIYDHWRWALEYPSQYTAGGTISIPSAGVVTYTGHIDVQPPTMLLALSDLNGEPLVETTSQSTTVTQLPIPEGIPTRFIRMLTTTTTTTTRVVNQLPFNVDGSENTIGGGGPLAGLDSGDLIAQAAAKGGATSRNTALLPQVFRMVAYGLKPETQHDFLVQGFNKNSRVRPAGKMMGDTLISSNTGILVFDYYYDGSQAVDQDVTHTLLSNTANIATTWFLSQAGKYLPAIDAGAVTVEVSAPNSSAQYTLQVAADLSIPLNLIRSRA